jgi:hypothetical protein
MVESLNNRCPSREAPESRSGAMGQEENRVELSKDMGT